MPAHRKSKELHDLHSTTPNGRAADVSHVPSGRPRIPRDIGPGLRKTFKNLCSLLQGRRTLTAADGELIRVYCFVLERHEKNVAMLRAEGEVCQYTRLDNNGQAHLQYKTNLRLKIVVEAEKQMAAILNQLGFSPTAKDRAKPTSSSEEKIVPGSIADVMPHLLSSKKQDTPFFAPSADLAALLREQTELELKEAADADGN
jgi:P27 family predicted phage terminase small subunit